MKQLKTTVCYNVPEGFYCNHSMRKSTPLTRCRFCTEVSKANFVCVLHNEPLLLESGALIYKTKACLEHK